MIRPENKSAPAICPACKLNLTAAEKWRPGPVVHCVGTRIGRFGRHKSVHHGRRKWRCPRCGGDLGCDRCAGRFANNVLCERCLTFADGDVVIGSGQLALYRSVQVDEQGHRESINYDAPFRKYG